MPLIFINNGSISTEQLKKLEMYATVIIVNDVKDVVRID